MPKKQKSVFLSDIAELYRNKKLFIAFCVLILFGIILRCVSFGSLPGGLNQDEAFAGYEAYSLLHYGIDTSGYRMPCYFVAWGSGMNVLESYLAIPFVAVFGLTATAVRLPQLIFSIICLPVLFLLLKRMFGNKCGICGLALLAVSPWSIMSSRWALESNLAPSFILIAFYFLALGLDDEKYWIFSSLFFGLSLYAYALTWVFVPLSLLLFAVYTILCRKNIFGKRLKKIKTNYIFASVIVLFILAIPLLLFLFVNYGYIPEIKTPFLSVPKLLVSRSSELSFSNIFEPSAWKNLIELYLSGNDGLLWNSVGEGGIFYKASIPFFVIGLACLISRTILDFKEKRLSYALVVLVFLFSSTLCCVMEQSININRINSMHYFVLVTVAFGINNLLKLITSLSVPSLSEKMIKYSAVICVVIVYLFSFVGFCTEYYGDYNISISDSFNGGAGEAIVFAKENQKDKSAKIAVDNSIFYPQVLFYDKTPVNDFIETVVYENYPAAYLSAGSFTDYVFGWYAGDTEEFDTYIVRKDYAEGFSTEVFEKTEFSKYAVLIRK